MTAARTLLLLAACASEAPDQSADTAAPPPAWCSGGTTHLWDPVGATEVQLFPDGALEVDDPTSPTGRRVEVTSAPWAGDLPGLLSGAVASLSDLSGFGTLGGQLLRFSAPVTGWPTTAEESVTSSAWQLVDLSTSPPTRVPFTVEPLEDGATVLLWPLRPLTMGAEHALLVTTDAAAAEGGCISPAPATRALLWGDPPAALAQAAPRAREALRTLDLAPEAVSALSVYTVHDDVVVMKELVDAQAAQTLDWATRPTCTPGADLLECTGTLEVEDVRNDVGLVDPAVAPTVAAAPVSLWLPSEPAPWPAVVFGHGLGSDRLEGAFVAQMLAGLGVAVVAMDAVEHGEHPSATGSEDDDALRFLGLDIAAFSLNTRALRGNFDQTTLDRLRLVSLLEQQPDLDGDGIDDLDPTRIAYLGISLGAVLGPELLALHDLDAAVFSVGGAGLISLATESDDVASFEPLLVTAVGSQERYDRLLAVIQHAVDPSDPGAWAQRVVHRRLDDAPRPHLLSQVGLYDDVVPAHTGYAFARALDLTHLAPVVEPVELLTVVEDAPLQGNLDGVTAGFFQFEQVTRDGATVEAQHGSTPQSVEGQLQMRTFVETWLTDSAPAVINPFAGE